MHGYAVVAAGGKGKGKEKVGTMPLVNSCATLPSPSSYHDVQFMLRSLGELLRFGAYNKWGRGGRSSQDGVFFCSFIKHRFFPGIIKDTECEHGSSFGCEFSSICVELCTVY